MRGRHTNPFVSTHKVVITFILSIHKLKASRRNGDTSGTMQTSAFLRTGENIMTILRTLYDATAPYRPEIQPRGHRNRLEASNSIAPHQTEYKSNMDTFPGGGVPPWKDVSPFLRLALRGVRGGGPPCFRREPKTKTLGAKTNAADPPPLEGG